MRECVIWKEMREMKEGREKKHARNVERKAGGSRSGGNVERNVSLEDLHPDRAPATDFSWPHRCLRVTSENC